jgi:hypothetical protein
METTSVMTQITTSTGGRLARAGTARSGDARRPPRDYYSTSDCHGTLLTQKDRNLMMTPPAYRYIYWLASLFIAFQVWPKCKVSELTVDSAPRKEENGLSLAMCEYVATSLRHN